MSILERALPTEGKIRFLVGEFVHKGFFYLYEGNILHIEKGLQNIMVVEHPFWKKILFINGLIQFTLKDEFIYHESLTHIPIQAMPEGKVRRVLICGGGDLGAAREVLKYKEVEEIVIADIDSRITEVVKEFFPEMIKGVLNDHRIRLIHIDAFKVVEDYIKRGVTFDLVIIDSTDPDVSSGETVELSHSLFGREFHLLLKRLVPDGIIVQQVGVPFTMSNILEVTWQTYKEVYTSELVHCYRANIPSFGGDNAFVIRSAQINPVEPVRRSIPETKYYTHDIHRASFVLPKFWDEALSV
ncbi:MAG: spermine synthase [Thermodesulfovibrionales bacterium]